MALAEAITYRAIDSNKLTPSQRYEIDELLRESLGLDYDRPQREIDCMVREASASHNTHGQSYAKPVSAVAVHSSGRLLAHVPAADTASSVELAGMPHVVSDVVGAGVRQAKLHVPAELPYGESLLRRRWMWLGICGLSAAARQVLADTDKDEATLIDGLLVAAARSRKPQQPAAAYPYDDEFVWKRGLASVGFVPVPGSRMTVTAFGPLAEGVGQTKWAVPDLASIVRAVKAKRGADELLSRVKITRK